jgi:HSP20 family protein
MVLAVASLAVVRFTETRNMTNKSWLPNWGNEAEHFRGFKTQIDSLFEDWFGRSTSGVLAPRIDVAEDERMVTLTVELPGVSEKDIEISLVGDQLTAKGEKRSEHEEKRDRQGFAIHRMERSYGAFQRSISVPYAVDPEQVSAVFVDGVLKIALPKPADAVARTQGRKIEINKPSSSQNP